ncbi:GNAT family N-acetyltransferase [Pimelobacter simplex]|uniref:GNAT family N-acetyltransferase n=1 Tax=Nocardioides simplex TaxID=2045 RepID=UPI00214F7BF5|nr:GNAT family N-acetyltransferase [Pimelobacter simplex]UUW91142.1 GNAT family N-acetyltransferase [Pimelobacter simplex]UUW94970.1 GNAT family N-acetyltransferase [Pimelobacter simplex]
MADLGSPRIRRRRAADLPALAGVLFEQQPETRYPYRDPLPIPVESFLHADDARAAWTAEFGGRPVGHVCWTAPDRSSEASEPSELNRAAAAAHGCAVDDLGWVSTLFVGPEARGYGVGRRLLDTAVAGIREAGRRPCLEVLPLHAAAERLYRSAGWVEAARLPASWAPPDLPVVVMVLLGSGAAEPELGRTRRAVGDVRPGRGEQA